MATSSFSFLGKGILSMDMKKQMSDTIFIGALLAIVGGFLDAYTYLCRGEVFANAQTGNMVLLGIKVFHGDFANALYYFFPILAFFVGILIAEMIKYHFAHHEKIHWRQIVLVIELIGLVVVAVVPQGDLNMLCNIIISFVCSLQVESFRKFNGNPYASTMCTGNLRSATEHLYHYRQTKDKKTLRKSLQYYMIILFFIGGACLGTLLTSYLSISAIVLPIVILFVIIIFMFIEQVG